ncbi:MAG: ATP-binding protein [Bacteroidota bacterium]|nr:ATP-binding protein [Bacteroidota bacterium]
MFFNTKIKVVIGFTIAVLIIGVAGIFSYRSIHRITQSLEDVSQENPRLDLLEQFVANATRSDELVRAYVYDKRQEMLDTLNELSKNTNSLIYKLENDKNISPEQKKRVDELSDLFVDYRDLHFSHILLANTSNNQSIFNKLSSSINTINEKKNRNDNASKDALKKRIMEKLFPSKTDDKSKSTAEPNYTDDIQKAIDEIQSEQIKHDQSVSEAELEILTKQSELKQKMGGIIHDFIKTEQLYTQTSIANSKAVANNSIYIIGLIIFLGIFAFSIFVYYILSDLSLNAKLRKELVVSQREALKLAKTKEKFLANMSHEIRTPLNAIVGFSEQLSQAANKDEVKKYSKAINTSSEHLLNLVNDILDYSKLDLGKVNLENIPFDPNETLQEIYDILKPSGTKKNISVELDLKKGCPQLFGDSYRLKQITLNLLSNAIKFTEKGKVVLSSDYIMTGEDSPVSQAGKVMFNIKITDTGIGINEENIDKIFSSFNQAHESITRKYGGTGLGLAICKKLIEMQNGNIAVKSEPGKGTEFNVFIPYNISFENLKEAKVVALNQNKKQQVNAKNLHVLIVDDDSMNVFLMETILGKNQFSYSVAQNGREALFKFNNEKVDIVLTDINMPVMSGEELLKEIRKYPDEYKKNIPVIALSADVHKATTDNCQNHGFTACLLKPFKEETLLSIINTHCGQTKVKSKRSKAQGTVIEPSNGKEADYELSEIEKLSEGNSSFVAKMLDTFVNNARENNRIMLESIKNKDYESLSKIAHKSIPSFSFVGLSRFIPLLKEIENNAFSEEHRKTVIENVNKITNHIKKIIPQLETHSRSLKEKDTSTA